jgi:hypothetical protein
VAEERISSTAMSDARRRNIRMISIDDPENDHDDVPVRRAG